MLVMFIGKSSGRFFFQTAIVMNKNTLKIKHQSAIASYGNQIKQSGSHLASLPPQIPKYQHKKAQTALMTMLNRCKESNAVMFETIKNVQLLKTMASVSQ